MLPPMGNVWDTASPYNSFVLCVHLLTLFQFIWVVVLTYRQINADTVFVDWEPTATSTTSSTKSSKSRDAKVSVWRTILCANEWSELQSMRKIDIKFTLFFLAFFLLGALHLEYNATPQPDLDNKTEGQLNVVLRFANTTFFWLIISYGQWLFKYLFYERYISEPPEQVRFLKLFRDIY